MGHTEFFNQIFRVVAGSGLAKRYQGNVFIEGKYLKTDEFIVGSLGPSLHFGERGNSTHNVSAIVCSPVSHMMVIPINHFETVQKLARQKKMQRVVELFNSVKVLAKLPISSKRELARNSTIVSYRGGSLVLKQGDRADSVVIILSGMFRMVRTVTNPAKRLCENVLVDLGHMGEGEIVVGGMYRKPSVSAIAQESSGHKDDNKLHERGSYDSSLISLEEYIKSEVVF